MTRTKSYEGVKPFVVIFFALLLLGASSCGYVLLSFMGFGGFTPGQCVRSLRSPYHFLAVRQCVWFGDRVLPHLRTEFQNYEDLRGSPSQDVALILGSIKSASALNELKTLYSRTATHQKLIGALGLIIQGQWTEPLDERSFLIQCLRSNDTRGLAIIALGVSGKKEAVPYLAEELLKIKNPPPLEELLKQNPPPPGSTDNEAYRTQAILETFSNPAYGNYGIQALLAEALGNLEDQRAIPALEERMRDPNFYAIPEAFRALIVLGEREAVPLAVARISPEIQGRNSGLIVEALSQVTGQHFGFDRQRWEAWWRANKDSWQIPVRVQKQFKSEYPLLGY